ASSDQRNDWANIYDTSQRAHHTLWAAIVVDEAWTHSDHPERAARLLHGELRLTIDRTAAVESADGRDKDLPSNASLIRGVKQPERPINVGALNLFPASRVEIVGAVDEGVNSSEAVRSR